jgi:hypothetical protein
LLDQSSSSMLAYKMRRLRNVVWDNASFMAIRLGINSPRKPVRYEFHTADRLLD